MDVEQLMKLIDKVSESDLTGFKYEENGIKLQLNKKENLVMGTTAPMQAVTPEDVKVTGASSKAATDLEEGVQKQTGISEAAPVGNVVKAPLVGTFYAVSYTHLDVYKRQSTEMTVAIFAYPPVVCLSASRMIGFPWLGT